MGKRVALFAVPSEALCRVLAASGLLPENAGPSYFPCDTPFGHAAGNEERTEMGDVEEVLLWLTVDEIEVHLHNSSREAHNPRVGPKTADRVLVIE